MTSTPKATEAVSLAKVNLNVPRICFGLAPLGNMPDTYGYGVSEEEAHATVNAIFDSGFGFLDTSRNYGLGVSEQRIGDVIRARGGLPKGVIISSKLDRDFKDNHFDAKRARQSLEQSLKALGVDRIQMLHLHDPEWASSLDGIVGKNGALAELFKMKEEGLCDAVGLAAGRTDIMMPMLKDWDFDVLITHNRFTLANHHAEPMIDLAVSRKIAVLNAAPYASGVLAKGSANAPRVAYQLASGEMLKPFERIEAVCAKYTIPPGAAALQFSMRDSRVASTIVGVSKPQRIQQTLDWASFPISDAAWAELMALPFDTFDPEATRDYKLG